jgi:hypothetical protein
MVKLGDYLLIPHRRFRRNTPNAQTERLLLPIRLTGRVKPRTLIKN